jgi:spore maturation protein CgeB
MRRLAIIDKNKNAPQSQWKAAPDPKKFFHNDNNLVDQIQKYNPDIIFINKGGLMNIARAVQGFKSVYFYGDFYDPIPAYVKEFAEITNAVIFTNKDPVLWWWMKKNYNSNVFFCSQGADTDIFKPLPDEPKKYDIVFGGNYFGSRFIGATRRLQMLRFLLKKGYNLMAVGDNWPKDIPSIVRQPHVQYNKIINQAKITVGMSHFINIPYYTSNRLYQMMATGVPHISWYSPDVKKIFKSGYIDAGDPDELIELIDHFLPNDKARRQTGQEQRSEILENHTIHHAWQRMEKILQRI